MNKLFFCIIILTVSIYAVGTEEAKSQPVSGRDEIFPGTKGEMPSIYTDWKHRRLIIKAVVKPKQFNRFGGLKQHHFIVAEGGKADWLGLFNTFASDSEIHEALIALGAVPGNNLTLDTWKKRRDKDSAEPDKQVSGTEIRITFQKEHQIYQVSDFLQDRNAVPFKFKFAGNLKFIPEWRSGCVVCLQGCPGGKIGHAHYTIRDLYQGRISFTEKIPKGIEDSDTLAIIFEPVVDGGTEKSSINEK